MGETSSNTVFVAHSVRPNWLTPTSQTPKSLAEIAVLGIEKKDSHILE